MKRNRNDAQSMFSSKALVEGGNIKGILFQPSIASKLIEGKHYNELDINSSCL